MSYYKKGIVLIASSILFAIAISFILYNIRVILAHLLKIETGPFTQPNPAKLICYFLFTYFINFKTIPFYKRFWILFTPILLVDATTLVFGHELIPLRFPFATLYPLFGIYCGLLIRTNRVKFFFMTAVSIAFIVLSHLFFIPSIVWYMHRTYYVSLKQEGNIYDDTFIGINKIPVNLLDTLKRKPALIEFYFVGCAPCEEKYKYIRQLHDEFQSKGLEIVLICDGVATEYNAFVDHWKQNQYKGITFLYDSAKSIQKYNIDGYPTELLTNRTVVLKREKGFGNSIANRWMEKERLFINKILDSEK